MQRTVGAATDAAAAADAPMNEGPTTRGLAAVPSPGCDSAALPSPLQSAWRDWPVWASRESAEKGRRVRIRVSVAVACAALCVASGTGLAFASGSERSDTMPFSGGCGHHPPKLAPHLLGARAQFTLPSGWSAVRERTPGPTCARRYVLVNPPGGVNRRCEQVQVYAQAGAAPQPPTSLHSGFPVLARGALPTVAGMQGSWEELDVGVAGKYHAYQISAGYESTNHRLFYELIVIPPSSYPDTCHSGGPQARASARQLARSFRVAVTDPPTAETFS